MARCPNCGYQFSIGTPKTELEIFLKQAQKELGRFISLKREINAHFGLKRFADLPEEKYPEALEFAKQEYLHLTTIRKINSLIEKSVLTFLEKRCDKYTYDLRKKYEHLIKEHLKQLGYGETDPKLLEFSQEKLTEMIEQMVGEQNVWEFAYKPA